MANKRYYWIKLNEHFFHRNDIKWLGTHNAGDTLILLYIKLMILAINDDGKLYFNKNIPFNESTLAMATDTDIDTIKAALTLYLSLGMMETTDDGVYQLCDYEDVVGSETASAARMRRKRDKMLSDSTKASHCDGEIE